MKYAWLILSYTVTLVSSQEDRVGDLFLAEKPYTDWFSGDSCNAYKGTPCNMEHCAGSRYANDVCCCAIQLDRIPPEKPVYIVADVSAQTEIPVVQQPIQDTKLLQNLLDKLSNLSSRLGF